VDWQSFKAVKVQIIIRPCADAIRPTTPKESQFVTKDVEIQPQCAMMTLVVHLLRKAATLTNAAASLLISVQTQ